MSLKQMEIIRTYVEDLGGGLVMIGGDQSFGLGGYYKTTLEEILPVRSNFDKEKEKPSLAMVLVIDKSGSMGGEKIELAKDADLLFAECALKTGRSDESWPHLNPEDAARIAVEGNAKMLALVHFDAREYTTLDARKRAAEAARKRFDNSFAATDDMEIEI